MKIHLPNVPPGTKYKTGIVIMVKDRFDYVQRCFESLSQSELSETVLLVFDDVSSDPRIKSLIEDFSILHTPVVKIFLSKHKEFNIHENLKFGFDLLVQKYRCSYLGVLDSDMIVKPYWLKSMHATLQLGNIKHGECIVSGFHCWEKHCGSTKHDCYYQVRTMGGANMLFEMSLYERLRLCLTYYWDDCVISWIAPSITLLTVRPSVVQHTGRLGLFSSYEERCDEAKDYYSFTDKKQWRIYLQYLASWYIRMPFAYLINRIKNYASLNRLIKLFVRERRGFN